MEAAKAADLEAAKAAYKMNSAECVPKCKPAFVSCFKAGTTLGQLQKCQEDSVTCQKNCVDALGPPPQ